MIMVLNKIDMLNGTHNICIPDRDCNIFEVSAVTGQGIPKLISGISELLSANETNVEFTIPYNEGWILPYLYENGRVSEAEYKEDGIKVKAVIKDVKIDKIRKYLD